MCGWRWQDGGTPIGEEEGAEAEPRRRGSED